MKDTPLSNCERVFILKAIAEKQRLDGREAYDYRQVNIVFGVERGCCTVQFGNTRVLCQVSCEVTEPKQTRPTEGILFVNVELSPMAAPQFEPGRQSDEGVRITRLLERCIKESRCVDTESLCIMSGIKVWTVRVDIHILNHDGNLVDCASVAAIAALAHFRRPDVTVSGEEVTIHSLEERDPVPLSVHHMPICVTFAFFDQGKYLLVDPTDKEEKVMDGQMVIGMNKHREICTFQSTGIMLLQKEQVLRCSNIAVVKVTELTELIHQALDNDTRARSRGEKCGFAASVVIKKKTAYGKEPDVVDISDIKDKVEEIVLNGKENSAEQNGGGDKVKEKSKVKKIGKGTVTIGEGGASSWGVEDDDIEMYEPKEKEVEKKKSKSPTPEAEVVLLDSESEEEVVIMEAEDIGYEVKKDVTKKAVGGEIDLSMALKKDSSAIKSGKKKKKGK